MNKPDRPHAEIILGVFFMFISFILSFLMVINVLTLDASSTMVFSFFLYALSLIGLVLGFHGVFELLILRSKKPQE